ncbi:hypothetical protein [Phormidium sp. CCY1219]|uniref:hypothetical protein n=1 Tax=Phormidium sp. CCY1219 TaxID=2886104 RepID=UPI002D1F585E|nr:hypothetical protein [Phormidium sp. CCY1219]MEB3828915.1 outer membrane protein assembly factor BamD [Phormidium sp. CCY1219]
MNSTNFRAGIAALKAEDYGEAIAHLESVLELELHQPTIERTKMALAIAYEGDGKPRLAWKTCQDLLQSKNAKVKQWADHSLSELDKRYPSLSSDVRLRRRRTVKERIIHTVIQWLKQSEQRLSFTETAWEIIEEERQKRKPTTPVEKLKLISNIVKRACIPLGQKLGAWIRAKMRKIKGKK